MGLRIYGTREGPPYPIPIVVEMTCDGCLLRTTMDFDDRDKVSAGGWKETYSAGEPIWLGPCCSGKETLDWRVVFNVSKETTAGLSKDDLLDIVNARYRRGAANAANDEAEKRRLNLAVEAARKELGG